MTPTVAETVFYCVLGIVSLAFMLVAPHINPQYDPKGNDPYRYCPKEEDM